MKRLVLCFAFASVMVSAKQGDNSVAMAIQSLVRQILEKQSLPRKWRPIDKPEKEKKPPDIPHNKLQLTGIERVSLFSNPWD